MQVLSADPYLPADKTIPATNVAGRRAIDHTGHWSLPGKDQILKVLSHRLAISQIVILLDQAVAELLKRTTTDLPDLQGKKDRKSVV
jgi:hypothetical protein